MTFKVNPLAIGSEQGYRGLNPNFNPTKVIKYVSPLISISADSETSLDISGVFDGKEPDRIWAELVCISADSGYVAGEVLKSSQFNLWDSASAAARNRGIFVHLSADYNTIYVVQGDDLTIMDSSTFDLANATEANFKIRVRAELTIQGDVPDITRVGMVPLKKVSIANGDASVDIDLRSYFNDYETIVIRLLDVRNVTDSTNLIIRTSSDGGSTFDSSADYYRNYTGAVAGATSNGQDSSQTSWVGNTTGTASDHEILKAEVEIDVVNWVNASRRTMAVYKHWGVNATGSAYYHDMFLTKLSTGLDNAVQFVPSSGNLKEGTIIVYGKRRVT